MIKESPHGRKKIERGVQMSNGINTSFMDKVRRNARRKEESFKYAKANGKSVAKLKIYR